MMRNARWAAASASFNNRTNISTDLPDNSYPKKGPRRGAPGKGENMGWILTGRRSTTRENIHRQCKETRRSCRQKTPLRRKNSRTRDASSAHSRPAIQHARSEEGRAGTE